MLSEQVQYQGKAGYFILNFQFSNSQNTGKRLVFAHTVTYYNDMPPTQSLL